MPYLAIIKNGKEYYSYSLEWLFMKLGTLGMKVDREAASSDLRVHHIYKTRKYTIEVTDKVSATRTVRDEEVDDKFDEVTEKIAAVEAEMARLSDEMADVCSVMRELRVQLEETTAAVTSLERDVDRHWNK